MILKGKVVYGTMGWGDIYGYCSSVIGSVTPRVLWMSPPTEKMKLDIYIKVALIVSTMMS